MFINLVEIDEAIDEMESEYFEGEFWHSDFRKTLVDASSELILLKAGIKSAEEIIIATAKDIVNLNIALIVKKLNPTLTIKTEVAEENRVSIRIADNGVGMNETVSKQIFDPFFTTKPVGKGTGIGLAISYQIVVEKHGGQLSCVSQPGRGTEFIIEVPINQTVAQAVPSN